MVLGMIRKQPADFLDYDIDFSKWLIGTDAISTIVAQVTRDDGAVLTEADLEAKYIINNNPRVKVWLINGVDRENYKVELTITTDDGRVKQVELRVRVRDI